MKTLILFIIITGIIFSIGTVHASLAEVKYPVAELGNCNSQTECEAYCDDTSHMEACLNSAEKYGLMTSDEIAEARKFMPFMLAGDTPGKCKNKKECDAYCNNENNLMECIEFAKKAGIISDEEYQMIKKTGGKGPGGCKGKEECDAFCDKEENFPTCVDFAVAHGMMDAKDAEMAKKTGGKGPGGCKSREECDAFCNNPDNQETCMNFAQEHGLMSEEELANMKKNQEFTNSGEGKCFMQCMKDAGVDSKNCGENGGGPEACKTCADKCFAHDETSGGRCLSKEKWEQLNQECQSKGSGYHLEEVKGDNGQGGECVTDETCVYSSGEEWENQAEKDRKLAEMQKQWDQERGQYESEHGPGGSYNEGGSGGSGGGCTQPGPEGQCNPGPGAGPEPGSEGGGSGGDSGSSGGGSEGSGDSGGSSGSEGGSSGGDSGVTGGVISEISNKTTSNDNWLMRVIKWIFRM